MSQEAESAEPPVTGSQARQLRRDDMFRLLVESIQDYAIFLLDPTGHILTWNEGARRIKGYTADEIIGKHFSIFYPEPEISRGKPEHELELAVAEGRWEDEGWRVRKDGSRFWANVVITTLWDAEGRHVGFSKVTRDLTDRKQAEEERTHLLTLEREARGRTETAIEQLRAIQSITEAALSHLNLEDLLHELLNRISQILGVDTVAVLLIDDNDPNWLVARAAKGLEEEVERGVRLPVGRGFAGRIAGERRPIVLDDVAHADILNPILREKGLCSMLGVPLLVQAQVIGVLHVGSLHYRAFTESETQFLQIVGDRVAMAIDHARLIEAARTARQEAEIAEATVRARDEFLSIAAHELKTPLTSLRLSAQMMLRRFDAGRPLNPAQAQGAVQMIDGQISRLSRLVTQLLETVRLQAGKVDLQRSRSNLTDLVRQLVDQAQSGTSHHEIVFAADEAVPASVDPLRFEQVVTNLLDNAIKYSPDGGRIDVELSRPAMDRVRLAVRDRGLGVAEQHRPHLFERFYQAHGHDYRSGMGLGLYISREIVTMHGGQIHAEFPPDGGTRFVVEIPTGVEQVGVA